MARDYIPDDDYTEDDQLLAEAAYRRACEEAADEAAWRRDMASEELGPWPTAEEIAEYEEHIRRASNGQRIAETARRMRDRVGHGLLGHSK